MGGRAGSTVAQREAEVADNLFRSLSSSCHYHHQEVTLLLHRDRERPLFEADLISGSLLVQLGTPSRSRHGNGPFLKRCLQRRGLKQTVCWISLILESGLRCREFGSFPAVRW